MVESPRPAWEKHLPSSVAELAPVLSPSRGICRSPLSPRVPALSEVSPGEPRELVRLWWAAGPWCDRCSSCRGTAQPHPHPSPAPLAQHPAQLGARSPHPHAGRCSPAPRKGPRCPCDACSAFRHQSLWPVTLPGSCLRSQAGRATTKPSVGLATGWGHPLLIFSLSSLQREAENCP